jgi:hypothetical protein
VLDVIIDIVPIPLPDVFIVNVHVGTELTGVVAAPMRYPHRTVLVEVTERQIIFDSALLGGFLSLAHPAAIEDILMTMGVGHPDSPYGLRV